VPEVSDIDARAIVTVAVFQRLPHHFQYVARKLRQLVQEQHTLCESETCRTRNDLRDQPRVGNRMVGDRKGRTLTRPEAASSTPATLWIFVVSSAS